MCFHSQQSKSPPELKNRFDAKFEAEAHYKPAIYNGFEFAQTPVITNAKPNDIQLYNWGLIPAWAKDNTIRQYTLNARIETLDEKPSFKNVTNNRCLVLTDGFYEWKWLDAKGKKKQKYLLTKEDKAAFAFAGLWSEWIDKLTGEIVHTYTIITTEAKDIMREIHNSKYRMPVMITPNAEKDWLHGNTIDMNDVNLIATECA